MGALSLSCRFFLENGNIILKELFGILKLYLLLRTNEFISNHKILKAVEHDATTPRINRVSPFHRYVPPPPASSLRNATSCYPLRRLPQDVGQKLVRTRDSRSNDLPSLPIQVTRLSSDSYLDEPNGPPKTCIGSETCCMGRQT